MPRFARPLFIFLAASVLYLAFLSAATKKPPLKPVNLNTATSEELQQVPGIGPATAEKILLMRKSYGSFKSVDDLLAIKGLGKKRLEKMRKYLTVSKPAPAKAAASRSGTKSKSITAKIPKDSPPADDSDEEKDPPRWDNPTPQIFLSGPAINAGAFPSDFLRARALGPRW